MDEFMLLCLKLKEIGKVVSVESNGTVKPPFRPAGTRTSDFRGDRIVDSYILDWKLPLSGYSDKMSPMNFEGLLWRDFVKFVISSRGDFDYACSVVIPSLKSVGCRARMAFSPCFGKVSPEELFKWLEEMKLYEEGVFLNVQLHKVIWPEVGYGEER